MTLRLVEPNPGIGEIESLSRLSWEKKGDWGCRLGFMGFMGFKGFVGFIGFIGFVGF